jgi:integrase/DNA-binding transcriptional regulator YhcF (GntR family)
MAKRKRERGSVRQRGGSYEVRVYAGSDPLTKKPIYLTGTCDSPDEAEKLRTKFLSQVDEKRNPKRKANIGQILDQYIAVAKLDDRTREDYRDLQRLYLNPTFGTTAAAKLNEEMLELFYARLRVCKEQCEGKRSGKAGHRCVPLGEGTIRKLHFILRPALRAAVRWQYVGVNVAANIDPPSAPRREPDPPTAREAAAVLNDAWKRSFDWAVYLWLAMVTGSRRGELCGLLWRDVDFDSRILNVAFSEQQHHGKRRRKDTKGHQKRRISIDRDTEQLLLALHADAVARCAALGLTLSPDAYLFSYQADGSEPWKPDTVTQRYGRNATRLKLSSTRLHSLRHYSATELIAAGVDLRTVAGRLGHGSGGATTLRVYSAWSPGADERAATVISKRLPRPGRTDGAEPIIVNGMALACPCGNCADWASLHAEGRRVSARCAECGALVDAVDPDQVPENTEPEPDEPESPYQQIAAQLRKQMDSGELAPGDPLPTVKQIAVANEVSYSTGQRALSLLAQEGRITVSRGVRATVAAPPKEDQKSDSWAE